MAKPAQMFVLHASMRSLFCLERRQARAGVFSLYQSDIAAAKATKPTRPRLMHLGGDAPQMSLEFRKYHLDWIQVRRIRRQEQEPAALLFQSLRCCGILKGVKSTHRGVVCRFYAIHTYTPNDSL